jgi:hypothetical protein
MLLQELISGGAVPSQATCTSPYSVQSTHTHVIYVGLFISKNVLETIIGKNTTVIIAKGFIATEY